ncbi:MAG TPA: HAMP domain-containing sensor histidine kinase [Gammaproteobacteria bacterium]|nr:HAMP domain-containing sensor histidine kinase [Gammaproteobacteria bacterium]
MIEQLERLRVRLTAWYVGVFALVLVVFGAALFYVLTRQISARLDDSLADAVDELERAAEIRIQEGPPGPGRVDALDELRIPDRRLYVFDDAGRPLHDVSAPDWVRALAAGARADDAGERLTEHEASQNEVWRGYARRFRLSDGRDYVGVSAADVVEIHREYPGLLLAFVLAAVLALALVGAGGWLLALRSTRPVRDAFQSMRGFMADAAHELRTPVAVVKGHADVALRQPRETAEYREILAAIHREAARLDGILENLLTIARADAGAWPVHFEPLYLDDLLLDVVGNARALGSGRVTLDVAALEEAPVRGDRELLRQLLMILLDNAVKFSPPGGRVDVAARRKDEHVSVSVADEGLGIEAEHLPRVFDRFFRGDPAHARAPGAGLGLAIARWIADVHHATIAIDSAPGRGTVVAVTFPLALGP